MVTMAAIGTWAAANAGTIAAVTSATAAVAGAGISAYSARQQGKAQDAAAKAQAEQYRQQAKINQAQAEVAQLQGEQEARRRYALLNQDIGSLYAQFAGNGLDINTSGVVGKALTSTVNEGVQDVKTINDNTRMNVWSLLNNKTQNLNSANISVYQGKAAKQAGTLSAWGEGVKGVGSAIQAGSAGYDAGSKFSAWWQS